MRSVKVGKQKGDSPQKRGQVHRTKLNLSPFLGTVPFLLLVLSRVGTAEMIYKLDGRVTKVEEADRILYVEFKHPATEEVTEKKFKVPESTGFKHVKNLGELEAGDLVSVDYLDQGGELVALYVDHIPLKEIAMTTPQEVAKTLLKLKSGEDLEIRGHNT